MSANNFLEKLLDGAEVEWVPLGEVTNVLRGRRLTRKELSDDEAYSVYHGGLEPMGSYSQWNRPANTVMVINVGASAGSVGYSPTKFWSSDGCFAIEHCELLNNRFLYYTLIGFQHHLRSRVRVAGIPTLDANVVESLEIPIPCPENPAQSLAIQAEIVRILDSFTELTAELRSELTAELTARAQQYAYYRDELLSFNEGEVDWKTLGELTESIASGRNKSRSTEGNIPVYGSTGLIGLTDNAAYSGDVLLIARVGANAGLVNAVTGDFDVSDNTIIVCPKDKWNIRFAFHQLTHMNLNQYAVGGGQPLVTGGLLKSLKVPLPEMKDQERIAGILDKFATLTHSLSEGLPREIELRQQQYEHYRDLLLNFPKPAQEPAHAT